MGFSGPKEQSLSLLRESPMTSELKASFERYGSDKASTHDYYRFYALMIEALGGCPRGLFEIGLGTNNTQVISNMGKGGSPGASVRAFRDHISGQVYGADVDAGALFTEPRIETFLLDQLDQEGLNRFASSAPKGLDVFIDDGLHSPTANLNSLALGLRLVNSSRVVIIEDLRGPILDMWRFIGMVMNLAGFKSWLLRDSGGAFMFVVSKNEDLDLD